MNKKNVLISVAILVILAAVFAAVYFLVIDKPTAGEKHITVDIVHSDKSVKTFEISTSAEYLKQALDEKSLIQGEESSYGFFVTTADGETADSSKQQWWNLTQNGEYSMTGVSATPIKDGDKFELIFTVGY